MDYPKFEYKKPFWDGKEKSEYENLTVEEQVKWEVEAKEVDAFNSTVLAKENEFRRNKFKEAIDVVNTLFGAKSKEAKYLSKCSAHKWSSSDWSSTLRWRIEQMTLPLRKKREAEATVKKNDEYLQKAIIWLQDRKLVLGTDFTLVDAIYVANNIHSAELIAKKIADSKGEVYVDDNICECELWDGESNRCSCGNRRLYWESNYGFSFDDPNSYVYPQAD